MFLCYYYLITSEESESSLYIQEFSLETFPVFVFLSDPLSLTAYVL